MDGAYSRRGRVDCMYRQHAVGVLMYDPAPSDVRVRDARFFWLIPRTFGDGTTPWRHKSILTELGRLLDGDLIRTIAEQVCELRPAEREGVALIRSFRQRLRDREPKVSTVDDFTKHVLKAVDVWMRSHPTLTDRDALDALRDAAVSLIAVMEGDEA